MDMQTILNNIENKKKQELVESKKRNANLPEDSEGVVIDAPSDIYNNRAISRFDESKKQRPKGSSAMVKAAADMAISGAGAPRGAGLAHAYSRAKSDSDFFKERGERNRMEIVRNQYMEERFLPAVEFVIAQSSPDEVLNCKGALDEFDKLVLGPGSSKGYTASYIRSAYGNVLGQNLYGNYGSSDAAVADAVRRIISLSESGENRAAIGVAMSIKKQIDEGSAIASDEDFALIGRVASYGN